MDSKGNMDNKYIWIDLERRACDEPGITESCESVSQL